jgi:hypothetical protein
MKKDMGTIDEIIKVIDDKLIENRKDYLSLGTANQLLAEKKIITPVEKNNKTLKKLLEEKKLPHAYQTEDSPKQWRIPLSEEGKIRKKTTKKKTTPKPKSPSFANLQNQSVNHIICPGCGLNLFIPAEIINEKHIQCLTCGKTFRNPLKISQNDNSGPTKTQRNWIIAIAVFAILYFIGSISKNNGNENDGSNSNVHNSYLDASVSNVERYLKANLSDPNSYESIEWSAVNEMTGNGDYKYWVRHKYRAKNSYGGYVIENKIFYLDSNGNVNDVKDVN